MKTDGIVLDAALSAPLLASIHHPDPPVTVVSPQVMKSLLITTEVFAVGGLETHLLGEIACLAAKGVRIHVVTGSDLSSGTLGEGAASVSGGLTMGPGATFADLVRTVDRLRRIIREQAVDSVHAHPFTSLIPTKIAAELEGIPFAMTLHGPASLADRYGPLYDLLLTSVILPTADMVVAVSPEVAALAAPYVDAARLCMLPNGVPVERFAAHRIVGTPDPRWLLASRLDAHKIAGIRDFARKSFLAGMPGLLIVGAGDSRDLLESQLAADGLSAFVEFAGATLEMAEPMRRFAGVAGMGRVVLEGLACGKPVVLVGYDSVKGRVSAELFDRAAEANFSGRNLPDVDAADLARQLAAGATDADALSRRVRSDHSDRLVWARFLERLQGLQPRGRSALSDTFMALASEAGAASGPYLNSGAWLDRLAPIIHAPGPEEHHLAPSPPRSETQVLHEPPVPPSVRDGEGSSRDPADPEQAAGIATRPDAAGTVFTAASDGDAPPLSRALQLIARRGARATLRALPISIAAKQRLRDAVFSIIRPRRHGPAAVRRPGEPLVPAVRLPQPGAARDVFVFAVIDWHFRTQRPQHLARSLATDGRRVFYFSNHFIDADQPGYQIERLPGAEELYQVRLHVAGAPAIYFGAPADPALDMLASSMARFIGDFGALSSISIIQHAYWYPLVRRLPNSYRVYDCMDHHEGFGGVPAELVDIEKQLLRGADLVTVTSSWLDEFARAHNPNVALVRNAADYAHFADRPQAIFQDGMGRKIIGYYGAIAEWFDLDLIRRVAQAHPDCSVLLIGNDTVEARRHLRDLPNVGFTGEVAYDRLPFYLHAFDVCLLPFKAIPLTLATNPVKVYEYLAAGKPVVCVDLPEVGQFGELVSRARSPEQFVEQVGAALAESGSVAELASAERRRFASEQTWRHRAAELETALAAIPLPRVSVVVLTFNNLELTRACIDSLLLRSDYPNLEIIVVDNASSDGTQAYLNDLSRRHSHVRVILNEDNVGFAAGNNIGMSAATGDYLVLLNNDTVVTHGWVMTLLRHFQANPQLGLLGPVTNNIGNEARIETSYRQIDAMPSEAVRHTLSHMGQRSRIPNLAFFCVMFPRSTYERCGPISQEYGRGFFEDDDYCRRVELAGLSLECAEDVFVHHHLSAAFSKMKSLELQALFERNRAIYESKWGTWTPHEYRS